MTKIEDGTELKTSYAEITEMMNIIINEGKKLGLNRKVGIFKGYDKDGHALIEIDQALWNEACERIASK